MDQHHLRYSNGFSVHISRSLTEWFSHQQKTEAAPGLTSPGRHCVVHNAVSGIETELWPAALTSQPCLIITTDFLKSET